ncbi:MAG TPA: thiamine phosphate synthase [Terriglobales bacterium]|nr:thiamine phosphate synthase [Terriglobales bacterium]
MVDYSLYLVADADCAADRDLVPLVEATVRGGVTVVQLRAKSLLRADFVALARRLVSVLKRHRVPLIINDWAEIALSCGAAGLHLGQDDLPLAVARKVLADEMIIGISVNTPEEAREAERRGADYVGAGPVFATATKATDLPVLGPQGLRRIRESVLIPVVAIGGITGENARSVREAGADGIAVVSALLGADDPQEAARGLKRAMNLTIRRRDAFSSSVRRSL